MQDLKEVEENLLLKCNMLESTDPELAKALKEARDADVIISKQPSKDIPALDLQSMLNDRERELNESSQYYEEEEEEETLAVDTEKHIEIPDDLSSDWGIPPSSD